MLKAEQTNSKSINLMTWNMLSKSEFFCNKESFPKSPEETLKWDYRIISFKKIFEKTNPDIICIQELDNYADMRDNVISQEKFESVYYTKDDGVQGIGIFFDKSKFSLLESERISLPKDEEGNLSNQFFCYLFLKDNITNKTFCVISTHLKSKSFNEPTRLAQVKFIACYINSNENFVDKYTKYNSSGMIICGDFNAEPSYSCIQHLLEFKFSKNLLLSNTKLHSAYNFLDSSKDDYLEMTTFKFRDSEYYRVIDYIFYTEGIKFLSNTPTIKKSDPSFETSGLSKTGFPNSDFPSDHYYLTMEFTV
jgi:mRNA deadenylase 3'-5' endonuclease subunit Ccr4